PLGAVAGGRELKNATHDSGLGQVDCSLHVEALPATISCGGVREDLSIVVAVDTTARDMAGARLAKHRVRSALSCLLTFHVIDDVVACEHWLGGGARGRKSATIEIAPHAAARREEPLEGVVRLNGLAAEPGSLAHDENVEGRPRVQCVHE